MLKLEKFPNIIQYAVYSHPYRLCIYYANFFWESTNENANLSLGTGMGFSYCVHLIIKPKTWQFWVILIAGETYNVFFVYMSINNNNNNKFICETLIKIVIKQLFLSVVHLES